jgi:hypothetical protein
MMLQVSQRIFNNYKNSCTYYKRGLFFTLFVAKRATNHGKVAAKKQRMKSGQEFLMRLTENRRLEPKEETAAGRCAVCGRDIYHWEIACSYAVKINGSIYCGGCKWDRHMNEIL